MNFVRCCFSVVGFCLAGALVAGGCGSPQRNLGDGQAGSTLGDSGQAGTPEGAGGGKAGGAGSGGSQPSSNAGQPSEDAGAPSSGGASAGGAGVAGSAGTAGMGTVAPCGGADLNTDPANCGTCGNNCAASPNLMSNATGITCKDGACVIPDSACATGKKHCSAVTTDVCETDVTTSAKCGACNTKCDTAQICTGGACADNCPTGETKCAAGPSVGCYALASTTDHCGACGTACPAPPSNGTAACQSSACKVLCSNGYHQCGTSAECEANNDATHCGSTCKLCETNDPNAVPTCSNNTCTYPCATGYQFCGFCISKSDQNNCGSCGNSCGTAGTCTNGACVWKDGNACNANADCLSGKCSTFYLDADNDKHGTPNTSVKVCGTVAPTGYVTSNDDCCEVGTDAAKIFGGQTTWFPTATTSCNKGWDYNCNGVPDQQITDIAESKCVVVNHACLGSGPMWTMPTTTVPACGASGTYLNCVGADIDTGTMEICGSSNSASITQGCH